MCEPRITEALWLREKKGNLKMLPKNIEYVKYLQRNKYFLFFIVEHP